MEIKGCFLKFGEPMNNYIVSMDCDFTIPKVLPIVYRPRELGHHRIIGSCSVVKSNNALYIKDGFIFDDKLSQGIIKDVYNDGGGLGCKFYAMDSQYDVKNEIKLLKKAKIVEVNIIPNLISKDFEYDIF